MPDECGIVVEGPYDSPFYEVIIKRICPAITSVVSREAGNKAMLMNRLPGLLRSLQYASAAGGPVRRVIAIRDTDGKDPAAVEADMLQRLSGQAFVFPRGVMCHATHQEMETWLLADINAINRTAQILLGTTRRTASRPAGSPEAVVNAKEKLQDILTDVGLLYDAATCTLIAQEIDLAVLRAYCPSFRRFEPKVCIA
jgi:uncharacterized protein DUF4276